MAPKIAFYDKEGVLRQVDEEWDDEKQQDVARPGLQSKGFQTGTMVRHVGTGDEVFVPDEELKEALDTGKFEFEEMSRARKQYEIDRAATTRKAMEDGVTDPVTGVKIPGQVLSGMQGFADVATMGFSDELAGVKNAVTGDQPGGYTGGRDAYRDITRQSEEVNPWSSRIGKGAAIGASLLGGAPAAGAALAERTLAQKAAQGAMTGAGYGAVGAAGSSEADLTKGEVGEFAKDVVIGTGAGAGLGAAVPVLGGALKGRAAQTTEDIAGINTSELKQAAGGAGKAGEQILEEGMMPATLSRKGATAAIAERANTARGAAGEKIGDILKEPEKVIEQASKEWIRRATQPNLTAEQKAELAQAAINVKNSLRTNVDALTSRLTEKANELRGNPAQAAVVRKIEKEITEFDKVRELMGDATSNLSAEQMNKIKSAYDDRIYKLAKQLKGTDGLRVVREVLKESIEKTMTELGEGSPEKLKAANAAYKRLATITEAAVAKGEKSRAAISLFDMVTGGMGYLALGPKGAIIGAAKALERTPAAARAEYATGKALQSPKAVGAAARTGQQAGETYGAEDKKQEQKEKTARALMKLYPQKYKTISEAMEALPK